MARFRVRMLYLLKGNKDRHRPVLRIQTLYLVEHRYNRHKEMRGELVPDNAAAACDAIRDSRPCSAVAK